MILASTSLTILSRCRLSLRFAFCSAFEVLLIRRLLEARRRLRLPSNFFAFCSASFSFLDH